MLVGELLRGELAQAADHGVTERARDERRARLDQGHGDARVGVAERAGTARAGEASADDHDAGPARLGARREGTEGRGGRRRDAELEERATVGLHFCSAYQAAIAWISASVNPSGDPVHDGCCACARAEVLHRFDDLGAIAPGEPRHGRGPRADEG